MGYLLSGYIGIRAGRRSSFRLPVGWHVEEVPDKDSVIVRAADDLELIELEPEHSPRMFLFETDYYWSDIAAVDQNQAQTGNDMMQFRPSMVLQMRHHAEGGLTTHDRDAGQIRDY